MTDHTARALYRAAAAGLRGEPFPDDAPPPQRRLDRLCELLRVDPRGILPGDLSLDLADRLLALAVAGASTAQLQAAAGDVVTRNKWGARRRLAEHDWSGLRQLARAAHRRKLDIARDLDALLREDAALDDLLTGGSAHPASALSTETDQ